MRSVTPSHCARAQILLPYRSRGERCQRSCWQRAQRSSAHPRPSCAPTATGSPGSQPRLCSRPYRLRMAHVHMKGQPCKESKVHSSVCHVYECSDGSAAHGLRDSMLMSGALQTLSRDTAIPCAGLRLSCTQYKYKSCCKTCCMPDAGVRCGAGLVTMTPSP